MTTKTQENSPSLERILEIYLDVTKRDEKNINSELEVRFSTKKNMKRITRTKYEDVIKYMMGVGFKNVEDIYKLNIKPDKHFCKQYQECHTNIRVELLGLGNIMKYCDTNNIELFRESDNLSFTDKSEYIIDDKPIRQEIFNDFGFSVALSKEKNINTSKSIQQLIRDWTTIKKQFRYIHRHRFVHADLPYFIDMSISKQSKKPVYTFQESKVLLETENYEIEIEIDNLKIGVGSDFNNLKSLTSTVRKGIMIILSGLQNSNYPISYIESNYVLQQYMTLLWGKSKPININSITSKNFVGPSSVSLQLSNLISNTQDTNIISIHNNYAITDKAINKLRTVKLLFINTKGRLYLIDTNMNIQFTGTITENKELYNTLLDGEHIMYTKTGSILNLYAAFDIYYIKGKDIRGLHLMSGVVDKSQEKQEKQELRTNYRLNILNKVCNNLDIKSVSTNTSGISFTIQQKDFYTTSETNNIFNICKFLLQKLDSFSYETDGIIFTPINTGVGLKPNQSGKILKPLKTTWDSSFKWKPSKYNTIDFLVTFQNNTDGSTLVKTMFETGFNNTKVDQLTQYITAVLRVGFDEKKHGYVNPCQLILEPYNIIKDSINKSEVYGSSNYRPVQFYPTNPSDDDAGIVNLILKDNINGNKVAMTHEGEVIENNMIVEFSYDASQKKQWRWKPLRVRYDKTAELRAGQKNYGNAYHVANSNWHSINHPITEVILSTGENIPKTLFDIDTYYTKINTITSTRSLRDFHNLYVKRRLIKNVSKPGDILIDFAVGKAGDLPKWISSKLAFVFGIDISRDNIENRLNGACVRYINSFKRIRNIPGAVFVAGNSTTNIRNTDAIYSDKNKHLTNSIFGIGARDKTNPENTIYKYYGIGENGFNISSIQFALHYMFENNTTLTQFIRNVSETTKVGGYFIGTVYNGERVFNMLQSKKTNETIQLLDQNNKKMWEITKRYTQTEFPDNVSSLGYGIDIYQESIGKTFREYLVNFDYLDILLSNYGFRLITNDEANNLGFKSGRTSFSDLFNDLEKEYQAYGSAKKMTQNEKTISFLNDIFIYKKTHTVDARSITHSILNHKDYLDNKKKSESDKKSNESIMSNKKEVKIKSDGPRKTNKRVRLRIKPS